MNPSRPCAPPEQDPPATIPMQPEPADWAVATIATVEGDWTVISRTWRPGDVPRCRLCDRCSATRAGLCVVTVNRAVDPSAARLFSVRAFLAGGLVGPPAEPGLRRPRVGLDSA